MFYLPQNLSFTEETVATGEVINQVLHHVGAMCIHQLNLLAASSNSLPLGALLGKQHPIEARLLSSICDIMEKAMVNGDTCIIRCILVVFQVSFRRSWVDLCKTDSLFRFIFQFINLIIHFLSLLTRWCLGFSILSRSRIGRACVVQVYSCGSYSWLRWIR